MNRFLGELSIKTLEQTVTWKIPNFLDKPWKVGYSLESPRFHFADATWYLRLLPNGSEGEDSMDIWLRRFVSSVPEHNVSFTLGLKTRCGEEYEGFTYEMCFNAHLSVGSVTFSRARSNMMKQRNELVPDGTLTVFCHLCLVEESKGGELYLTGNGDNSAVDSEQSLHKEEERNESPGVRQLQLDYKKLLQSTGESDVSLVLSGREFRAHRCILGARSPVFSAMFSHETEEKNSGRVDIVDLDPDSFQDFLEYMYTGSVEAFSDENAFALYEAADKYDVQVLKSECLEYVQRTLSVDSFCDVMVLALRYQEKELMNTAIEFFKENLTKIILTVKWQVFLNNNGTKANELLVKALIPEETKQTISTEQSCNTLKGKTILPPLFNL